ncbi:MAG: gamma-glutamyl-gamma-aminobutyrate hydrolase family protein [Fimbriimonadaceae bacterium]
MSATRPVIGITADVKATDGDPRASYDLRVKGNYAQAVADAGGIPILIPPEAAAAEIVEVIDGLLIPGGDDIDSVHFGQTLHPKALLQNPRRFEAESALYRAAPKGLPILGICYGCQFINVMEGGSLIQHLPDVAGTSTHTGGELQAYDLEPGTKVAEAIGATRAEGKSYHHQAVEAPGTDVRVTGHAADGTVEAIEVTSRDWTVAVQWHPERTLEDAGMKNLFRALVREASAYRAKRVAVEV